MEERENGLYDFMVEIHKRAGAFYVGRYTTNLPFHLFVKKEVSKVDDFKGMKLRSGALYDEFMKGIGAIPTTIPWPEVYNAATQGVIEGAGATGFEWGPEAYAEMFNYVVWPSFYEQNLTILVNMDVWNNLSKKQQNLMLDVCIQMEPEMSKFFGDKKKELFGLMEANGMKSITLPAGEAQKYVDIAYSKAWAVAEKKISPEDYTKLRKLLMK
jgi:TRAP-type C4-dicarboxylate transport system substrate-binding protein